MTKPLEALIADIKAAAEKATPGQWEMEHENIWFTDADGCTKHLAYFYQGDDVDDEQDRDNTKFFALANPANVLALIAALEQAQQSEEVSELLRDKVKRLESGLWDKEQLRKVYSEKSFDLEQTISSMKHEHAKNQSWLAGQVREMEDALCKLLPGCQYMDEPDGGDISPLEQVARMVADYRKSIAELEASQLAVTLPDDFPIDSDDCWLDIWVMESKKVIEAIRAAGITVQGDE